MLALEAEDGLQDLPHLLMVHHQGGKIAGQALFQSLLLLSHAVFDQRGGFFDDVVETAGLTVQLEAAAFDLGDIQNIGDCLQQAMAGLADMGRVFDALGMGAGAVGRRS